MRIRFDADDYQLESRFEYDFRVLEKHTLIPVLYEKLPDKSKVLLGVKV